MDIMNPPHIIVQIVVLFFSIVVHESAHGWMAEKCGDNTARAMGRITLNPLAHIDPFGTILFPLFLVIIHSPFLIGWAKPVPINPYNFDNPRKDVMKVGLAGPASNFLLAISGVIAVWILNFLPEMGGKFLVINLLGFLVFINLLLGIFNLLPIPPLDGSRILSGLLPGNLADKYEKIAPYGFIIIILFFRFFWFIIINIVVLLYSLLFWGMK